MRNKNLWGYGYKWLVMMVIIVVIMAFGCRMVEQAEYARLLKTIEVNPVNPYVVMQTTDDLSLIPAKVEENWRTYAPEYERIVLSDAQCINYLTEHYGENYANKFQRMRYGAWKADLFRYAWLYREGGVYCDIKTVLLKPLTEVFSDPSTCYMVFTERTIPRRIYNGVIATPPNNPVMKALLDECMKTKSTHGYLQNVERGYSVVRRYCNTEIQSGDNETKREVPKVHMFVEKAYKSSACDDLLDRYGLCMYIVDTNNTPVFKVRYHDYPWTSLQK